MNLEPIRTPSISGTALGHPDDQAFTQPTRLAGGAILLVDDTLAVVFAFRNR